MKENVEYEMNWTAMAGFGYGGTFSDLQRQHRRDMMAHEMKNSERLIAQANREKRQQQIHKAVAHIKGVVNRISPFQK